MLRLASPFAFASGAFAWTFAEYALHRFAGHADRAPRSATRRRRLFDGDFGSEHQAHHADTRYFTPTSHKVVAAAIAVTGVGVLASLLFGPRRGVSFAAGFAGAYAAYEIEHRRTHTHAPTGPHTRFTRRHHLSHHFTNPKLNHGVTTPLWDVVFGTYLRPGVIRIPRRHAPPWLVDPETGEVRAEHRAGYALAPAKGAEVRGVG
ncbi:MAG: sterol desaturase family protein [Sorangiineae bacterium]|nr:sterol desaturase family protein [Polyangiaceae bacterium]MEB2323399.1 sterol desaturase family protein [Sorangiineae bacterium]